MKLVPGDGKKRVPMTVTFLEMRSKPPALPPPQPKGKIAILRAEKPPVHFYRYLYNTIGEPYLWVDRRKLTDETLAELVQNRRLNSMSCTSMVLRQAWPSSNLRMPSRHRSPISA